MTAASEPASDESGNRLSAAPRVRLAIVDLALLQRAELALRALPRLSRAAEVGDAAVTIVEGIPDTGAGGKILAIVDASDAAGALAAGALSVLPRTAPPTVIRLAIDAALAGFAMLPEALAARSGEKRESGAVETAAGPSGLSAREREVLRLVAEGASNKEIARRLDISVHTAKFHVGSILAKLDASGRTDAVTQAVRLGLVML